MANGEEPNNVYVETNLNTRLSIPADYDESVSHFTNEFRKHHQKLFPQFGEINVTAFKVLRGGYYYHLTDNTKIRNAFKRFHDDDWFMLADVETLVAIMPNTENDGSVLVDGLAKRLAIEGGFETEKKRKIESSDGKKSRKKSKIDVATTSSSHELGGNVHVEVAMTALPIVKDIERGEKDGISMQASDADMLSQEKPVTSNSERVDERIRDEVNDVQATQTLEEALESDERQEARGEVSSEKVDDLMEAMEQDIGEGEESAGLEKIDQEKELAPISSRDDLTESHEAGAEVQVDVAPEHCDTLPRDKLDDLLPGAVENDIGRGEESSLAPVSADNLQTTELATYHETQLEASSGGPATEKRKQRKKSPKDENNQSTAAHSKTSRKTVNEINGVPENEMGEKTVEEVGRENTETNILESNPASQVDVNGGLTTGLVSEKKRKRTETSQSTAEVVNEREKVSDRVDTTSEKLVNALKETIQNENELGDKAKSVKSTKKIKSRKTKTPNGAEDIVQVADLATTMPALVQESKALDNIGITDDKRTLEHEVVKDNGEIDADAAKAAKSTKKKKSRKAKTPNAANEIQAEDNVQVQNEVVKDNGEVDADESNSVMKKKKSRKTKTPTGADEIQAEDNVQVTGLATTHENEVAKDNGQVDADEAKSVMKSTKKKKSRKTTTLVEEDTLVDAGPQNVEPFKVVDGEGPDSVIRNVLDSLHQRNQTQERLDTIEKKASKKSKKSLSSNMVDSQVLSVEVNNVVQEAVPPVNNPEDTYASWTSVKKNTKSDASRLKNRIETADNIEDPYLSQQTQKDRTEVADNDEDPYLSQQTQREKADMGDNFRSRQKDDIVVGGKKQDNVAGGAKSIKEKKSVNMHPAGSIDGSLSSMKPKERKTRGKPASSGTSLLKTRLKNDRIGSKVDDSITTVKKSSNLPTMNKNTLGFFKDAKESYSSEDESKKTPPHVSTKPSPDNSSTKSPPDSSDDDSDVTSMSRQQGNDNAGGALKFSGSLQDILRSSKSYKKAKVTASQYMSDDDSPALDFVPESQV